MLRRHKILFSTTQNAIKTMMQMPYDEKWKRVTSDAFISSAQLKTCSRQGAAASHRAVAARITYVALEAHGNRDEVGMFRCGSVDVWRKEHYTAHWTFAILTGK